MKMSQNVGAALIALLFVAILALIFQCWLQMPTDIVEYLKTSIVLPVLVAILTAWRAWSEKEPP